MVQISVLLSVIHFLQSYYFIARLVLYEVWPVCKLEVVSPSYCTTLFGQSGMDGVDAKLYYEIYYIKLESSAPLWGAFF